MGETKVEKRLYIGGLSHSISEKDIRDRFGKFGDVSNVEVITRHDDTGTPLKAFGYININISDSSLKKCMTVLNKSKWKGGTLQVEMAKESFLHRLAQERQQVAENAQGQSSKHNESLVESFKKAGVENFYMKAAVPGTEIPGHKNWVVSKFGRVLPVLHLKARHKHKYDPSKHSHNIKKLDSEISPPTSVSELTWELQGGDDEMSKKRRGEFPPRAWTPAKMKRSSVGETVVGSGSQSVHCEHKGRHGALERNRVPSKVNCNGTVQGLQARNQQNGSAVGKKQNPALKKQRSPLRMFDGDTDSEDEIRMLIEAENACSMPMAEADDDNLEVVGEDYAATPNVLWALRVKGEKKLAARYSERVNEEGDYDSADTDEIVTWGKCSGNTAEEKQVKLNTLNDGCFKGLSLPSKNSDSTPPDMMRHCDVSHQNSDSESILSVDKSEDDEDYEAMMASCYRLDLSLADLEKLAKKPSDSAEEESAECQESDSHAGSAPYPRAGTLLNSGAQPLPAKKGNSPDDILAAILAESDEESNNETVEKKKVPPRLPAFTGTKSLMEEMFKAESSLGQTMETVEDFRERGLVVTAALQPPGPAETIPRHSRRKVAVVSLRTSASEDNTPNLSDGGPVLLTSADLEKKKPNFDPSTFEDDQSRRTDRPNMVPKCTGQKGDIDVSRGSHPSSLETAKGLSSVEGVREKAVPKLSVPRCELVRTSASGSENRQKRQEDNQKRLAALQLRQKEAEEQKKLIQGALLHLDTHTASKGKHIVFESDTESEGEQTRAEPTSTDTLMPQKTVCEETAIEKGQGGIFSVKEFQKQASSKLFLSSDEEEGEDEDGEMFQIKPQFEGKAGQKLMALQSRFGTDERFRMDSRFLESDEEEAGEEGKSACDSLELQLEGEKKKNMEILQSVLHVNIKAAETSREAAKGKTFRDISALHYDPTREEHAAFESKREDLKQESKAERRKKRKVAEKIPEVSKDIFYSVVADLKETFGSMKDSAKQEEAVAWDQDNGLDDQSGEDCPTTPVLAEPKVHQESTEFKFSFFENNTMEDGPVQDNYKVETLQRAKMSWQVDPRFQDSSSDDEDEQREEEKAEDQSVPIDVDEGPTEAKKAFFFFFEDDERLKEGPRMFCRTQKLEDQREQWEEKRVSLIEDYRMKHKSARRRVKTSMKI